MRKRILAGVLSLVMILALLPVNTLAAEGGTVALDVTNGSISITESGYTQGETGSEINHTGTYTVAGKTNVNTIVVKSGATCDMTIDGLTIEATDAPAIRVEAGATLNLKVEGTNTLEGGPGYAGICVEPGYGGDDFSWTPDLCAKLTISGSGTLKATGGNGTDMKPGPYGGGAGIGGNGQKEGGTPTDTVGGVDFGVIYITKDFTGTINATGGTGESLYVEVTSITGRDFPFGSGAGIGSGGCNMSLNADYTIGKYYWSEIVGQITIENGTINAISNGDGAGIGGGSAGGEETLASEVTVEITGGTINATGGTCGAGIGGGALCDGGEITISGGIIVAKAGSPTWSMGGAGIGGGINASVSKVEITGGTITAKASGGAAGIGTGIDAAYSVVHYGDTDGKRTKWGVISISGENTKVEATGGSGTGESGTRYGGAGIGAGYPSGNNGRSVAFNISITDGATVKAYGGYHSQAIGYGYRPGGSSYYTGYGIKLELADTVNLWAQNVDYFQPALVANTEYDNAPIKYSSIKMPLIYYKDTTPNTTTATATTAKAQLNVPSEDAETYDWVFADGILKINNKNAVTGLTTLAGNWATLFVPTVEHAVTFDLNYESAEELPIQMVEDGQKLEEPNPAPTREGYTFDGWYTGTVDDTGNVTLGESAYNFDTPVTEDVTLYAKWHVNIYTVTYHVDGEKSQTEKVQHGKTAQKPTDPTKPLHGFVGWYTDEKRTQPYDFETPVTDNLDLYARFIEIDIEIDIDIQIDINVDILVDIITAGRKAVTIDNDQKLPLAYNIDLKNDVQTDTTKIEIDAIVRNAKDKPEIDKITEHLTENKYNCGDNRIDYDVIVQKMVYPTPGRYVQLEDLAKAIKITFAVPNKWQSGGTVYMFRAHDNEGTIIVEMLEDKDADNATYTIESDKFSTYTMIYVPSPGGGTTYYTLHYESNGGTQYKDERHRRNTVVNLDKVPVREGYQFTGWYGDKDLTEQVTSVKMTGDKTVYAGWHKSTVPDMLNGEDHFAYVIGYGDGTVHPGADISRAEVATIFFRLLKPEIRDGNLTDASPFADVSQGMWCNKAIATMAKLGIVKGRTAETFAPSAPITRAEFAAICARFDTGMTQGSSNFTDLAGHWAKEEIERAVSLGWIMGYADGTFRPDNPITRAEAMTMINRVLCRIPEDGDDLLPGMKTWPDNQPGDWYYLAVQEATNSHEFQHKGEIHEHWTKLTADPDWTRYQD